MRMATRSITPTPSKRSGAGNAPHPTLAPRERGEGGAKRLAGEGNTATKLVYAPCTSGAQIILWKLTGSGHVWPGSSKNFERLLGKPTHLFDASEEIWSFFSRTTPR